jgi:hypothetical protein
MGWIGLLQPVHYSDSFSGEVAPKWKSTEALSGGKVFRSTVDTSRHSFERPPQYVFTLVLPLVKHEQLSLREYQASTMIGSASADAFEKGSFRVYVGGMAGLTAKQVSKMGWSVQYMGFGRVDCKISPWSRWSTCTRNCGGGLQHKVRSVQLRPQGGGKPCKPGILFFREQPCNVVNCVGVGPSSFCGEAAPRGAVEWHAFGSAAIFTVVDVRASNCDFSGAGERHQESSATTNPSRRLQETNADLDADEAPTTKFWVDMNGIRTTNYHMSREYLTGKAVHRTGEAAAMSCNKASCTVCPLARKYCCLDAIEASGKCSTCAYKMGCLTESPTAAPTLAPTVPTASPTAAPTETEDLFRKQLWADIKQKMSPFQQHTLNAMDKADRKQIIQRLFIKKHEHDLYVEASKTGVLPPGLGVPSAAPTLSPTAMPSSTPTAAPSLWPCKNGVKDGPETDIDCGGPLCTPCLTAANCNVATDCASGICQYSYLNQTSSCAPPDMERRRRLPSGFRQIVTDELAVQKAKEWREWHEWHERHGEGEQEKEEEEQEKEEGEQEKEEENGTGEQRRRLSSVSDGEEGDDGGGGADTNGAATPSVFYAASVIGASSHWQLTGEATVSRMNASHFTVIVMHPVIHGKVRSRVCVLSCLCPPLCLLSCLCSSHSRVFFCLSFLLVSLACLSVWNTGPADGGA